jgi:beta-lactamase class A
LVLRDRINQILNSKRATVGVGILSFENGNTLIFNGNGCFPLQSIYIFYLVLAVSNQIYEAKLTLNQAIFVSKADMVSNLYSSMQEKYPEGNVNLPLSEIIKYTVSQSDNNG